MIGDRIKQYRKDNNLTQEDLADKLFVTRAAVSKWENGKSLPDIDNLQTLSEMLGITIDDLVGDGIEAEVKIAKTPWSFWRGVIAVLLIAALACASLLLIPKRLKLPDDTDIRRLQMLPYPDYPSDYTMLGRIEAWQFMTDQFREARKTNKEFTQKGDDCGLLFSLRINDALFQLDVYRAREGFFIHNSSDGCNYTCSRELLEAADQVASTLDPTHYSYLRGVRPKTDYLADDESLTITLEYEEGTRPGCVYMMLGYSADGVSRFVGSIIMRTTDKEGRIYTATDEMNREHVWYWINGTKMDSLLIGFFWPTPGSSDDGESELLYIYRIPYYEIGNSPLLFRCRVDDVVPQIEPVVQ